MANEEIRKFRRVVTGHDTAGRAIFLYDGQASNIQRPPRGGVVSTLFWATDETPASLSDSADHADRAIGIPPPINGSIFRVVEYAPDSTVKAMPDAERAWNLANRPDSGGDAIQTNAGARHHGMHRTKSIDYAVILSGEIYLMLDDSERLLKQGDVVVQQGTFHAWSNRSDKPCQIAFILIGAQVPWE
ncbi:MAG: cupin domain-containing protein [Hyphomicrobiales bacterium]|nr:cupin domain-containing protein [Hyphomicrobiales bacterium]